MPVLEIIEVNFFYKLIVNSDRLVSCLIILLDFIIFYLYFDK